ncbi:MAG TPA: UbiA family prenyltransferase [Thermoplasmata archaeon]|nr:UbiA family prenyltransferase [Thermoplasmata archaeon]
MVPEPPVVSAPPRRGAAQELWKYLELQNLGLNLPFAVGFLFVAADGVPPLLPLALILIAFVAARNAGHSFNRWADREYDARNPRTQDRALVTGRYAPATALTFALVSSAVLIVAARFLTPLAFYLSFPAVAIVFGYSYTKRYTALTTPFLGLVEAIVPAAVFIALDPAPPWLEVGAAVGAMHLWGTAFETIHSLGDLDSDRELGLRSLPLRMGVTNSVRLVPVLHAAALALFAGFGLLAGLAWPYLLGLAAIALVAASTDLSLSKAPRSTRGPFRNHFAMSALFAVAVVVALGLSGHPIV